MDPLADAACDLVESDSPTVRAACLRSNMLDFLVLRCVDQKRFVSAAIRLANVKTGRAALQLHVVSFLESFGATEDAEVARLTAELLLQLQPQELLKATHLVRAFTLLREGVLSVETLVSLMLRASEQVVADAFRSMPGLDALRPKTCCALLKLLTLRGHCTSYAPTVAKKCGRAAVRCFIESGGDASSAKLLTLLSAHVTMESYDRRLFTLFAPRTADEVPPPRCMQVVTSLLFRYMQLDNGFLLALAATERWPHYLKYLCDALTTRSEVLGGVASRFLLTLLVRRIPGHDALVLPLRSYMADFPGTFNFKPTDDPDTIEKIIACGAELLVDCGSWKTQLASIRVREAQQRRLRSVGIHDLSHPHEFCCPMTMEVMSDPVVASDGHTYEREALLKILSTTRVSPLTRERLDKRIVVPNLNLKKRIRDYPDDLCDVISDFRRQRTAENSDMSAGVDAANR